MLLAALTLSAALHAEPYAMNDVGATLELPRGWEMTRWSDWDFKAKSGDGLVHLFLWSTPFQVEVSDEAARAWADRVYVKDLEREGFEDVAVRSATVERVNGRDTAHAILDFKLAGTRMAGVMHAMAFTGPGQVIHVRVVSAARAESAAESALRTMVETLEISKGPLPTEGPEVESAAGFAATLPAGWRLPLTTEMDAVRAITKKVGEEKLAPEDCWVAMRPPPVGEPDVLLTCRAVLYLGPVDEYSFAGVEPEVRERFFGAVDPPVPAAEPVTVGDRTGFYFKPPREEQPVRLAVAPFEGRLVMMTWGLGSGLDPAGLDAAMHELLPTVRFTGPDGGKPVIGVDKWASYYLSYRPTSPVVLGPAFGLLALVVGGVALTRRKKAHHDDGDLHV